MKNFQNVWLMKMPWAKAIFYAIGNLLVVLMFQFLKFETLSI